MSESDLQNTKEIPTSVDDRVRAYGVDSRRAWLSLIGTFLIQFSALGPIQAFGVFQDFYKSDLLGNYSNSTISWIGTTALFIQLVGGVFTGQLYDRGYGRFTVLFGCTVFLFSFFMISLVHAQGYYQAFLAQGLGMGLGASCIFTPTITMISNHFILRKGLALGILSASGPLGVLIYTIMLNQLIHFGPGFAWAVRIAAFVTMTCMLVGNLLISTPHVRKSDLASSAFKLRVFLSSPPYTSHMVAGFLAQLGTFFPLFYTQTFAREHGVSEKLAFYAVAIMNAAGVLGRSVPGHVADLWGPIQVWTLVTFLTGALTFGLLGGGSPPGLILFCIFYGFFLAGIISVYMPVVATLTPPGASMGQSIGLACVPIGISALIGDPIIGAIVGNDEKWWKGATFAAVALIGGAVFEAIAGVLHFRHKRSQN